MMATRIVDGRCTCAGSTAGYFGESKVSTAGLRNGCISEGNHGALTGESEKEDVPDALTSN